MNLTLLLPEIILATAILIMLAVEAFTNNGKAVAYTGLLGIAAALLGIIPLSGHNQEIFGQMVVVDSYALFFKVLFLMIAALTMLSAMEYLEKRNMHAGEFHILVLCATLGMMFMAASYDLITIYLGLELTALSSYALAGMLKTDARSGEASLKYFLMGAMTSAVLLYGMSLIYGATGTTHLVGIAQSHAAGAGFDLVLMAGIIFLVAGFGFKIAAVPFHMWAPDTYHGAPTPVSAFLITASEAAAFAAIMRVFSAGFPAFSETWNLIFAIMAVITMTYGNVTAISQTNVKRMLAYSAIAQAGYVLVGVAIATPDAMSAVLYYLLAYAFMTIGAFAIVILLSNRVDGDEISDFKGLSERAPAYAAALVLFFLSFIGIPPTGGFFAKFNLFKAAIGADYLWLAIIMVINSVISVPYYYGVVRNMYLVKAEDPSPVTTTSGGLKTVVTLAAIGTLLLGLYPQPFLNWVTASMSIVF